MDKHKNRKYLKNALKITLSLALGAVAFWLFYTRMDVPNLMDVLRNDVNYAWIWLAVLLGLLSHVFRALRWKMLIEVLDTHRRISFRNVFYAVMVGYLVNFILPRAGEVARCGVVSKYEGVSFTKIVGTMIAERAFDLLILLLICVVTILLQIDFFIDFFSNHSFALGGTQVLLYAGIAFAALVVPAVVFRKQLKRNRFVKKIADLLKNVWQGMKTFLYVRSKFWFLFHGFMVWILYVAMLYACVCAFHFNLSVAALFTVFVMGSLGMMLPAPGGIGTFHLITSETLLLYNVGKVAADGFALVAHGAQTILIVVLGSLSFVGLQFRKPKKVSPFINDINDKKYI